MAYRERVAKLYVLLPSVFILRQCGYNKHFIHTMYFRNQHKDLLCRGCNAEIKTQDNVLQACVGIHKDHNTKVAKDKYFSEDIYTLTKAAYNIQMILDWTKQS